MIHFIFISPILLNNQLFRIYNSVVVLKDVMSGQCWHDNNYKTWVDYYYFFKIFILFYFF